LNYTTGNSSIVSIYLLSIEPSSSCSTDGSSIKSFIGKRYFLVGCFLFDRKVSGIHLHLEVLSPSISVEDWIKVQFRRGGSCFEGICLVDRSTIMYRDMDRLDNHPESLEIDIDRSWRARYKVPVVTFTDISSKERV
jgi:hypothetical protein